MCAGEGGGVDTSEQRERELVREKLKARGVSVLICSLVERGI